MTKTDYGHMKNKRTNKHEVIEQREVELNGWGFRFYVDTEMEAYKTAYQYRFNRHGTKVEYAPNVEEWVVTVFNAEAAAMGVDGAKE